MTQFNNELYAGFLPEAGDARFEGKRGFYPAIGGFRGHIPENCKKRDDGTWGLFPLDRTADRKQIIRVAF